MPINLILLVGGFLFATGIVIRTVAGLWVPLIVLSGIGFALLIVGVTLWMLDSSGDAPLS